MSQVSEFFHVFLAKSMTVDQQTSTNEHRIIFWDALCHKFPSVGQY